MIFDNNIRKPFFSVVIPVYNSEEYLEKTLASVINQTFSDFEIIISDDGSEDGTIELVHSIFKKNNTIRFTVLLNDHKGPGHARNKGIEASQGQWVSFLDSDDRWFPGKLEKVAEVIANGNIDLVSHSVIWHKGSAVKYLRFFEYYDHNIPLFLSMYRSVLLGTSTVSVKKEILLKTGFFDETLPAAQDYDLWIRLSLVKNLQIKFIDEALGRYFTRDGNISSNIDRQLRCMLTIGRRYYKNLKEVTKYPIIEKLRYEGFHFSGAGLKLMRRREYLKGSFYLIIGLTRWPFRFDKLVEKTINLKK